MMANKLIILTIGLLSRIFPMVNTGDHDLHLPPLHSAPLRSKCSVWSDWLDYSIQEI